MINDANEMPMIDSHVHIWGMDDIDYVIRLMDREDLRQINVLSLTACGNEFFDQNLLILLLKMLNPRRVYGFGGLCYPEEGMPDDSGELVRQVRKLMESGFDGLKMIEGKPNIHRRIGCPLDSPSFDPMFSFLADKKFPVLIHAADPEEFWDPRKAPQFARELNWTYWDGSFAGKEAISEEVEALVARYKEIPFIIAHFFFLSDNLEKAANLLETYPNLYFDLAPGSEMYLNFSRNIEKWHEFFIRFDRRILFGTDNLSADNSEKIRTMHRFLETDDSFSYWEEQIHGISLPADSLKRIYADNFLSIMNGIPRKVREDDIRQAVEDLSENALMRNPPIPDWKRRVDSVSSRLDSI